MAQSKAWDWGKVTNPYWLMPSEESYYLAARWKEKGYRTILDLGCGLGRHTVYFGKQGFSVSAMDLSPEGVDHTRTWAEKEGLCIDIRQGDMQTLPYEDGAFDCLFAYHVISHTDTPGARNIISQIRRVIRPGGEIYITLCSKETLSFQEAKYPRIDENTVLKTEGAEVEVPHFYADLDQVLNLLDGFEIQGIRHVDECWFDGEKHTSKHYFVLAWRQEDLMFRCPWCESNELMQKYHDEEWGARPCTDTKHFEFLTLEAAQAGLSWMTVLRRRESYREAFAGFDPGIVAGWGECELEILMQNPGLIRNRQKLTASIRNARAFCEVQREFGSFDNYLLSFTGGQPVVNSWEKDGDIPATTEISQALSADMKRRGFQFLGPTVVYSHMQAAGIVDDHVNGCFCKAPAGRAGIDPAKARVLAKIGRALDGEGILWAVGGSAMLYRQGIVDEFNDFDLVLGAQDVQKANAALLALGTGGVKANSGMFACDSFHSYEIDGVEVDVMAGMVIVSDGQPYHYLFDEDSALDRWPVNGVHIPFAALEDWYILYLLMGRAEKVQRIRDHFARHGLGNPALLARMLRPGMPETIRELGQSLL